jgi:putative transposase
MMKLLTNTATVSHQAVRLWVEKFGRHFTNEIRRRSAGELGDKWYLDEVVISIGGKKHWLWRAVHQGSFVLDVLVQRRRNTKAAKRLMRKLLKKQGQPPRVMITDKLRSYGAARPAAGRVPSQGNDRGSRPG